MERIMRYGLYPLLFLLTFNIQAASNVVVQPLSELLISPSQSAQAQVVNEDHLMLSARIMAEVESVHVAVGDKVEAGQVLVQLNCDDYLLSQEVASSDVAALSAQVRLARQQLKRADLLLKQQNASQTLSDQRRAELETLSAQKRAAQARLKASDLSVSRCQPKAPFAAVVTTRGVSTGALVNSGTPLLGLLKLDGAEISAALNRSQLHSLQQATQISFQQEGQMFDLTLRAVVPLVDQRAKTQEVRFSFAEQRAMTGSSGRLIWKDSANYLPVSYIVSREGRLGVMLQQGGTAYFQHLPEAVEGQSARVSLPPLESTMVIVEGQHSVRSGEEISVSVSAEE